MGGKTLILGYLCKDLRGFCIEGYDSWISLFLRVRIHPNLRLVE